MALKLITIMGTGKHDVFVYRFQLSGMRQSCTTKTRLQCIAMAEALKPTELLALVTPEARRMWIGDRPAMPDLHDDLRRVSPKTVLRPVDIPKGSCEDEVWELFDILTTCLDENDEVVLDITRGFRSQSMLVLMACVYLRVVKRIRIKHVLYGAAEASDPQDGSVPIFDLSPFIYLINFAGDVEVFLGTGNLKPIADNLRGVVRSRKTQEHALAQLREYSRGLANIAQSYQLAQPGEILASARELRQKHSTLKFDEMSKEIYELRAYKMVLDRVQDHYEPLWAENEKECTIETLRAHYELIRNYIRHGQELYAITLAREWLVSLACYAAVLHYNCTVAWLTWPHRKTVEEDLVNVHNGKQPSIEIFIHWNEDEALQRLSACYDKVRLLRNQTAHCGMLDTGGPPEEDSISKLTESIRTTCRRDLAEVAKVYGITALEI